MTRTDFRSRILNLVEIYFRGDDANIAKACLGPSQIFMMKVSCEYS